MLWAPEPNFDHWSPYFAQRSSNWGVGAFGPDFRANDLLPTTITPIFSVEHTVTTFFDSLADYSWFAYFLNWYLIFELECHLKVLFNFGLWIRQPQNLSNFFMLKTCEVERANVLDWSKFRQFEEMNAQNLLFHRLWPQQNLLQYWCQNLQLFCFQTTFDCLQSQLNFFANLQSCSRPFSLQFYHFSFLEKFAQKTEPDYSSCFAHAFVKLVSDCFYDANFHLYWSFTTCQQRQHSDSTDSYSYSYSHCHDVERCLDFGPKNWSGLSTRRQLR